MKSIDCPESSVKIYHYSLHNDPEERSYLVVSRFSWNVNMISACHWTRSDALDSNSFPHILCLQHETLISFSHPYLKLFYGISCCYLPRSNSPRRTSYNIVISEFIQMIQMSVDSVKHISPSHSHIHIQMLADVSYPAHT